MELTQFWMILKVTTYLKEVPHNPWWSWQPQFWMTLKVTTYLKEMPHNPCSFLLQLWILCISGMFLHREELRSRLRNWIKKLLLVLHVRIWPDWTLPLYNTNWGDPTIILWFIYRRFYFTSCPCTMFVLESASVFYLLRV